MPVDQALYFHGTRLPAKRKQEIARCLSTLAIPNHNV